MVFVSQNNMTKLLVLTSAVVCARKGWQDETASDYQLSGNGHSTLLLFR
jgi:hypothetical protein